MGQFRIEVTAVGGHGCQRTVKGGESVQPFCGYSGCPDCLARNFVAGLKSQGQSVESATLIHWPGQESEVRDDLVSRVRTGSF